MSDKADRGDVSRRIAQLPAEKRELLRRLLVGAGESPSGGELRITRDAVSHRQGEGPARRLYDLFNQNLDRTAFASHAVFLNLGYVANDNPRLSPIELPRHCLNRNCMQLALEVIADVDVGGLDVADVGCGRGGTIAVMNTYFSPRRSVGVDLSGPAVAFCNRTHANEKVHFAVGNAQALPLPSSCFDVVTNIESAADYPDVARFYAEVSRVLRPEGCFLYADVIPRPRVAEQRRQLVDLGFQIENDRDITSNVLLSCDEAASVHRAAVGAGHDDEVLGNFLAMPGSSAYERMRCGELVYLIYKARRSAA